MHRIVLVAAVIDATDGLKIFRRFRMDTFNVLISQKNASIDDLSVSPRIIFAVGDLDAKLDTQQKQDKYR